MKVILTSDNRPAIRIATTTWAQVETVDHVLSLDEARALRDELSEVIARCESETHEKHECSRRICDVKGCQYPPDCNPSRA